MPGAKPDPVELESRYEYTAFLLSRRLYKSDIKRSLMRKYNVSVRTCENYLAEAKRRMVSDTGRSRDDHRLDSLRFYESVLAGPDGDLRDRMHAQSRIDWLLGLEAPQRHEHDVNVSGDLMVNLVEQVVESKDESKVGHKSPEDAPRPEGVPRLP